jgi:hypothetical protein
MTNHAVLQREIETLPADCLEEVIDFIAWIKNKKATKKLSLEKAAEMAAEEYLYNKELTAFCVLDGEDFYEAR